MKARLLHTGDVPPGHVRSAFSGLAPPFAPGETVPFEGTLSRCYDATRSQYDAAGVLELVPEPEPGWLNLLLVGADLFVPALTYVFGLSHLGGRRGVLSTMGFNVAQAARALEIDRVTLYNKMRKFGIDRP